MPPEPKDTFADRFETTVGTRGSRNTEGQATVPAGLTDVAAISADFHPSLRPGGGWHRGGLGEQPSGQTTVPAGLTDVVAIAAGGYHSLALTGDVFDVSDLPDAWRVGTVTELPDDACDDLTNPTLAWATNPSYIRMQQPQKSRQGPVCPIRRIVVSERQ